MRSEKMKKVPVVSVVVAVILALVGFGASAGGDPKVWYFCVNANDTCDSGLVVENKGDACTSCQNKTEEEE